jgi:hypothetical protein
VARDEAADVGQHTRQAGLGNVMNKGWPALIVAGVWAAVAAVLFAVGRDRMKRATR